MRLLVAREFAPDAASCTVASTMRQTTQIRFMWIGSMPLQEVRNVLPPPETRASTSGPVRETNVRESTPLFISGRTVRS